MKKYSKKNDFYMILILIISDLCFPIIKIITIFLGKSTLPLNILGPVTFSTEAFKLYWAAAFSYFLCLDARYAARGKRLKSTRFLWPALLVCAVSTGLLCIQ